MECTGKNLLIDMYQSVYDTAAYSHQDKVQLQGYITSRFFYYKKKIDKQSVYNYDISIVREFIDFLSKQQNIIDLNHLYIAQLNELDCEKYKTHQKLLEFDMHILNYVSENNITLSNSRHLIENLLKVPEIRKLEYLVRNIGIEKIQEHIDSLFGVYDNTIITKDRVDIKESIKYLIDNGVCFESTQNVIISNLIRLNADESTIKFFIDNVSNNMYNASNDTPKNSIYTYMLNIGVPLETILKIHETEILYPYNN